MQFGGSWFVVRGRRFLCTYSTTYYSTETFWKFFPTISLTLSPADWLQKCLEEELSSDWLPKRRRM
jgi:hypothetical protein